MATASDFVPPCCICEEPAVVWVSDMVYPVPGTDFVSHRPADRRYYCEEHRPAEPTPGKPKAVCYLCKKPIVGRVYYQGGSKVHPCHKDCLVVIKG